MFVCLTTGNQLDAHLVGAGPDRTATFAVGVARTFLPRHRTQKRFDAVR
jgi:hypothetical protein